VAGVGERGCALAAVGDEDQGRPVVEPSVRDLERWCARVEPCEILLADLDDVDERDLWLEHATRRVGWKGGADVRVE
jgi:hypothetical protein